ncbi:hypothetical protein CYLTODRAFT_12946, partial [Cylindrobasidium torrendii FP15055 ss-10]
MATNKSKEQKKTKSSAADLQTIQYVTYCTVIKQNHTPLRHSHNTNHHRRPQAHLLRLPINTQLPLPILLTRRNIIPPQTTTLPPPTLTDLELVRRTLKPRLAIPRRTRRIHHEIRHHIRPRVPVRLHRRRARNGIRQAICIPKLVPLVRRPQHSRRQSRRPTSHIRRQRFRIRQ